ncbi:hypothetical protein LCGC14_1938350 [marine sediment metagenome]|uniref:Uncharacterized protein n=1 Tax=marine sediment metagenome TaxID=412755 RepID=A0A0F9HZI1_9ZZZZ
MTQQASNGKISTEQFFKQAMAEWHKLHPDAKSKGIHSVFSGFNESLREYYGFDQAQGIAAMNELVEAGKVVSIPRMKGPMLYLPGDAPSSKLTVKAILGAQV